MSKKEKTVVPKLRFSQFISSPEWSVKKLGSLIEHVENRAGTKKYTLMSVTSGVGLVPQIKKFGREIAGSGYKNYYVIKKNDFAYNKSATKQFPEGYISMLTEYEEAALPNSIFTCFRIVNDECEPKFFDHLFHNNYHGTWLRKYIEVGARAHGSLSVDTQYLWNMPVALPKLQEQQKIASCLSSLDKLIDAEDKKLSALNLHKKGLMQKLFPAEGETLPKWRFPEFVDEEEWNIYSLSNICINLDTKRIPITEKNRKKGLIPYYGASGIVDYVEGFIFDEYLLCVSEDGANLVTRKYPIAFSISGKAWVNNHAHVLKFENSFTHGLVESYLNNIDLTDFLTGMAQPKLNRAKLDEISIPLPKEKEQEKIAYCLFSINDLITAQTEKIEALKQHKKALMQGLFPSIEEVEK